MTLSVYGTRGYAAPFAYITNSGDGTVSVIDAGFNIVTANVAVGEGPYGVAVDPAGKRLYVTNRNGSTVSVIDIASVGTISNPVIATVEVGGSPVGVAVNPSGTRAYVANVASTGRGLVSVIDNDATSPNFTKVIATIELPVGGWGVAVNPSGTQVYVTLPRLASLVVIDTASNTASAPVAAGRSSLVGASGVAVHPTGKRVYVINDEGNDSHSSAISVIDTDRDSPSFNTIVASVQIVDDAIGGIAAHPTGKHVYATTSDPSAVWVLDTDLALPTENKVIASVPVEGEAAGVAVTPDGTRLYVATGFNKKGTVWVIDIANIGTNLDPVIAKVPVGSFPIAFGKFIGPSCQVNVQRLGQCAGKDSNHLIDMTDPANPHNYPGPVRHWGAEQYAFHVGKTMCGLGCATTSLSMALLAAKVANIPQPDEVSLWPNEPGHLNKWMANNRANGRYNDNNDVDFIVTTGDLAARVKSELEFVAPTPTEQPEMFIRDPFFTDVLPKIGIAPRVPDPFVQPVYDFLDKALCQGIPVIVKVPRPTLPHSEFPDAGHLVLVTGKANDDYQIKDPSGKTPGGPEAARFTKLSEYGEFIVVGYVEDPPGDRSTLNLSVGENGDVLIIDSAQRRTGFDPTTGRRAGQIPRSFYSIDATVDDETDETPLGRSHSVHVYQPGPDFYQSVVTGLALGPYTLRVRAFSQDGSPQPPLSVDGIAGVGSRATFEIQFNPTPGSVPQAVRVATFQSTLADISNGVRLGLIDNQGIANSLSRKISAAADAVSRRQSKTAINILKAFKNEVWAQSTKHLWAPVGQVLQEDADSLIARVDSDLD